MDKSDVSCSRSFSHDVLVTPQAIICIERRSEEEIRRASTIALVVGGLLGPLLAALADRVGMPGGPARLYLRPNDTPPLAALTDVLTCWASEVPPEVRELPGWPRPDDYRPVTIYPRAAIASVALLPWRGLRLMLRREAAREAMLPVSFWRRRRVWACLLRSGYAVEAPVAGAASANHPARPLGPE